MRIGIFLFLPRRQATFRKFRKLLETEIFCIGAGQTTRGCGPDSISARTIADGASCCKPNHSRQIGL
jgi:hypothetical protein